MSDVYKCTFEISCLMEDTTKGHRMNEKMQLLGEHLTDALIEKYNVDVKITPRRYEKEMK